MRSSRLTVPGLERHCLIESAFFKRAPELRRAFETRFADPRDTRSDRFVWDYWHVEGQFTAIRTPARFFFPPKLYAELERSLIEHGQRQLGCNGISDPWLSYYIDGCEQKLHADNPHGPWAYVYSLTDWDRRTFRGGETQVALPGLLDYWSDFRSERGYEFDDLFAEIPARFNQLLVFDPRLPHGVKRVEGVREPSRARIAIHGWFTEPRPFLEGALARGKKADLAARFLDAALEELSFHLSELGALHGTHAARVEILPSGAVKRVTTIADTVLPLDAGLDPATVRADMRSLIDSFFKQVKFPKATGPSAITIPFLFR